MSDPIRVVLETAKKKSFASAIDWPGWSRPAKPPEAALQTLADYAPRYALVVERAGLAPVDVLDPAFDVIETVPGTATTEFGAPDVPIALESEPMSDVECDRHIALLRASWVVFDDVAARVSEELQKGPRGGGRNRSRIIEHVYEAERAYVRNLGVRTPKGAMFTAEGLLTHRDAVLKAIREHNARGESARSWPLRYVIRRATWHVLDHAWEMEDKDLSGQGASAGRGAALPTTRP
jgi:hypothetical protein